MLVFSFLCSNTALYLRHLLQLNSEHYSFFNFLITKINYLSFLIYRSTKFCAAFSYTSVKYFKSVPDSIKISRSLSSFCSAASRFIASLIVFKRDWCNWCVLFAVYARARVCVCVCVWFQLLVYLLLYCCLILILLLVGFVTAIFLTPNHLQATIIYCIYVYVNYNLLYHIFYVYYSVNM